MGKWRTRAARTEFRVTRPGGAKLLGGALARYIVRLFEA